MVHPLQTSDIVERENTNKKRGSPLVPRPVLETIESSSLLGTWTLAMNESVVEKRKVDNKNFRFLKIIKRKLLSLPIAYYIILYIP